MRVRAAAWIVGVGAASTGVSAVAFGQGSTWGAGATPSPADGGAIVAAASKASDSTSDAGARLTSVEGHPAEGPPLEASTGEVSDGGEADAGALGGDAGPSGPSDVGFSVGLRGGYSIPFGTANGGALGNLLSGAVPIGADLGWFFSRRLYLGAYLLYGFGVGAGRGNDTCSAPSTHCNAVMVRAGAVVHWHFAPEGAVDPWIGAGLGYETLVISATNDADGSTQQRWSLRGIDLSLQAGLDLKPLHYLGFGPYVELATGPYVGRDSGFHGWGSLGARFHTNL